ncbi:branched-chain amino acid transporter permease [Helicobacter sp. MIT 14-3879]|uniref:branched-chain amino acid transporter permease n=1 Tax=Helicobacter sp. MIT 14-3879 TaxID=2040649 RepID=UPI000E1F22BD|nr:AzlD domain-containing protein [Helicobacter sp. MIT 14-3879]RDU62086.1 branched-chain amino acid transporter AzlD [Helicobacter sp. MIT 14-3879]
MDINILLIILVIAIANFITRFLVYFIMPKRIPPFINYISNILPNVIIAMLVVYCLKSSNFNSPYYGLKEIISIGFIVLLHLSIKIPIISVCGGVIMYMFLTQKIQI